MKKKLPDMSAVSFVDEIISDAVKRRASDIHFEMTDDALNVRVRCDGVLSPVGTVGRELGKKAVSRIKVMSGMDISEHKRAQDARITACGADIRVLVTPCENGENAFLRILDKRYCKGGAAELGIDGETLEKYKKLKGCEGLILLAGPTGSGKSSTMYSMLGEIYSDASGRVNTVTLEDPVEYTVTGATQITVNLRGGMTFKEASRAVLRLDPDIIAIGEIRDTSSAEAAYRSASTGHMTLATVHAKNATSLISRMRDFGIGEARLTDVLRGVVFQRLVKRVCPDCGGSGCDRCGKSGYFGRIGAFGIVTAGENEKMTKERLYAADRELADSLYRLAEKKITTDSEVKRVLWTYLI